MMISVPDPPQFPMPGSNISHEPSYPREGKGRAALLSSIQKGAKLKKVETNDRSKPLTGLEASKNSNPNRNDTEQQSQPQRQTSTSAFVNKNPPIAAGLGGLFSGGMPKLKPVNPIIPNTEQNPPLPPRKASTNISSSIAVKDPPSVLPFVGKESLKTTHPNTLKNNQAPPIPFPPSIPKMPQKTIPVSPPLKSENLKSLSDAQIHWIFPKYIPAPPSFSDHKVKKRTYTSGGSKGCSMDLPNDFKVIEGSTNSSLSSSSSSLTRIFSSVSAQGPSIKEAIQKELDDLEKSLKKAKKNEDFQKCIEIKNNIAFLTELRAKHEKGDNVRNTFYQWKNTYY